MSGPGESKSHLKQRRSPRFPFDSLVRLTVNSPGKQPSFWGRSTDLCRDGIGVILVSGRVTPQELVGMEIPLPAATAVTVEASVRYCKEARCGSSLWTRQSSSVGRFGPPVTGFNGLPGVREILLAASLLRKESWKL